MASDLRLYWYWPFLRSEDTGLATAVAAAGVDRLVVHTLDRPGAPTAADHARVILRSDLPDIAPARTGTPGWMWDRTRVYRVRRRMRAEEAAAGPDLTHVWFLNRFTDAVDLRRLVASGPVVAHVHDVRPHNRRLPDVLGDRLLRRMYTSGAHLTVHHEELRLRLTSEFGIDPAVIDVVPLVVRPVPTPPTPARDRVGDRVLFFGALRHNKGIDTLLQAVERADSAIRWEVMGRGEPALEESLQRAARRHPQLSVSIGHIDAATKAAAFDRADLVVLPYRAFESQSGVLHEAYAHGVPAVVTDVGALGPTVREDRTGVVVAPGDPDELADTIAALLSDDARRVALADATAAVAADRAPDRVAARLREVYGRLV